MKNPKLIIDCKIGDPLFIVNYKVSLPYDYSRDNIRKMYIKEIIPGFDHDVYKLEKINVFGGNEYYEFNNDSSKHDELTLDTDYSYGKNGDRIYSTYQGALNYLVQEIQYNLNKQLKRLEYIEENLGICTTPFMKIKTHSFYDNKEHYNHYTRKEIYDIDWYEDNYEKQIKTINDKVKDKKFEVWKEHVEYDALGRLVRNCYTWKELDKKFDTLEEANEYIWKVDKSRVPCEIGKYFFEGFRYYVKYPKEINE